MTDLARLTAEAIQAALSQNWPSAISANTSILKEDKHNIDALNRLGFAHLQSGQFTAARETFEKVIKLDRYNQIASRNLKKLTTIKRKDLDRSAGHSISPLMFLEEPGKTKIAPCVNLAPLTVLSTLTAGQEVSLKAKNHCVEIRDSHGSYLGALPDDLSYRMIKLLKAGNTYQVYVKGFGKNLLTVFIREEKRSRILADQPSFVSAVNYTSLGADSQATVEKPDVTATGEEETGEDSEETT